MRVTRRGGVDEASQDVLADAGFAPDQQGHSGGRTLCGGHEVEDPRGLSNSRNTRPAKSRYLPALPGPERSPAVTGAITGEPALGSQAASHGRRRTVRVPYRQEPERPTQEQTGKLSDGQRLVNSKFFGLDTPFPASSAMRPAQRIILAWIYAGNHDASSIAVRENHTILDPLAPSERHTVQFCDCGQRWKCGWRPAPLPRGTL